MSGRQIFFCFRRTSAASEEGFLHFLSCYLGNFSYVSFSIVVLSFALRGGRTVLRERHEKKKKKKKKKKTNADRRPSGRWRRHLLGLTYLQNARIYPPWCFGPLVFGILHLLMLSLPLLSHIITSLNFSSSFLAGPYIRDTTRNQLAAARLAKLASLFTSTVRRRIVLVLLFSRSNKEDSELWKHGMGNGQRETKKKILFLIRTSGRKWVWIGTCFLHFFLLFYYYYFFFTFISLTWAGRTLKMDSYLLL
ncbi:hypothetical protein F4811DRAFT_369218 [Daldinia bambusicola]|nr:hypothetical protein F4811DRAFT_369218 [Daldinia bambusicola]